MYVKNGEASGPRLFEREWISILTTSNQHRIHSKLRFRKNMPFSGSVRYLFLRRKSATKDLVVVLKAAHRLWSKWPFYTYFLLPLNQGLNFGWARSMAKVKGAGSKNPLAFKKSGAASFSILYIHVWLTKASRRMAVMTSSFCIKLITILEVYSLYMILLDQRLWSLLNRVFSTFRGLWRPRLYLYGLV